MRVLKTQVSLELTWLFTCKKDHGKDPLVVDDDASIVELLQFMLKREGHTVLAAHDGEEGLKARASRTSGSHTPGCDDAQDGRFQRQRCLFKDPVMRDTLVLIFNRQRNVARYFYALVPNVRSYMDKPFDPPDLLKTIRQLLIKVV